MPNEKETSLEKEAEELEEGDGESQSSDLDGSGEDEGDQGDELTPEDVGVSIDDLPEGARPAFADALKKVSKYLQDTREDESATNRGIAEKAAEYDKLITDPRIREALIAGSRPKGGETLKDEPVSHDASFPDAGLEMALAGDTAALSSYLRKNAVSIAKAEIQAAIKTLRESEITPLSQKSAVQEVSSRMDAEYGQDWRKHLPTMTAYARSHPDVMDVQTIYERAVEIPRLKGELKTEGTRRGKKKNLLGKTPKGASSADKTTDAGGEKKRYASNREAIADTLAQLERDGAGGK